MADFKHLASLIKNVDTKKVENNNKQEWVKTRRDDISGNRSKRRRFNQYVDDSSVSLDSSALVETNTLQRSASVELVPSDKQ